LFKIRKNFSNSQSETGVEGGKRNPCNEPDEPKQMTFACFTSNC